MTIIVRLIVQLLSSIIAKAGRKAMRGKKFGINTALVEHPGVSLADRGIYSAPGGGYTGLHWRKLIMEVNVLCALSDAMAQAVATAGASTVEVDARRGGSASGIVYQPGLILTASHVV